MELPTSVWVVYDLLAAENGCVYVEMLGVFTNEEEAQDIYDDDPRARFCESVAVNSKK